jgi:hypothetical protein
MQARMEDSDQTIVRQDDGTRLSGFHNSSWSNARRYFLAAVNPRQRPVVARLLQEAPHSGLGLRLWLRSMVAQGRPLPKSLPAELVQVYLDDPEAVPLHDCEGCGIAIPVHPAWQGYESEPQRVYFPTCPCCGGRTGLYAYWSNTTRC